MNKTLVLDINELYKVIPEAKALEGKNFKNIEDLLKNLITAIETSGKWDFIQYLNNKPSLFIIREMVNSPTSPKVTGISLKQHNELIKKMNKVSAEVTRITKSIKNKEIEVSNITDSIYENIKLKESDTQPVMETEEFDETIAEIEEMSAKITSQKLPWE